VHDLSFDVVAGEVVALLGPNGSGKTTSLKAAAGLVAPSAGSVTIDGKRASSIEARQRIAYLPQKVAFPESLTGREVVTFYQRLRNVDAENITTALRFASLNGASDRKVGGYSGGMVQRLGLAVSMLANARVMLLDEPTAALDPDGLSAFYELVEQRRHSGQTVMFTSHQLGDVEKLADRFGILVGGRLAALMSRRELTDRLAARGALHLRLNGSSPIALTAIRQLVADATLEGDEIIVPGPASIRPAVIECVRDLGVNILGLTTEESSLDALYRELVHK
jgi:Cu-processing system ATP-binding protein